MALPRMTIVKTIQMGSIFSKIVKIGQHYHGAYPPLRIGVRLKNQKENGGGVGHEISISLEEVAR